jgi:hypothetical protein
MGILPQASRAFLHPLESFRYLLLDRHRGARGFVAMFTVGMLYTLVAHFLDRLHAPPVPPPFLAIPADRYFHWATYFYTLSMLAAWVLASAILQVSSRLLGGWGTFEDTLALAGWASALGTLATLLPDLTLTSVQVMGLADYGTWRYSVDHGGAWFYIVWAYLLLYGALFLVFYTAVVRVVHRLSVGKSALVGTVGFLAYQGFLILFAR